jgi:hypothetical protein
MRTIVVWILLLGSAWINPLFGDSDFPGALSFSEEWQGILCLENERIAFGDHHVHVQPGKADEELIGQPRGLLGVFQSGGSRWMILRGGGLQTLSDNPVSWQALNQIDAYCPTGKDVVWLFGMKRLLKVSLRDEHPHVLFQEFHDAGLVEFRPDQDGPWLRSDNALYSLTMGYPVYEGELPADCLAWAVHAGRPLVLRRNGELTLLPDGGFESGTFELTLRQGLWSDLLDCGEECMLRDRQGGFVHLAEGSFKSRSLGFPEDVIGSKCTALPDCGLLIQSRSTRRLWRFSVGWVLEASWDRPPQLKDQHFRYSGRWTLDAEGGVARNGGHVASYSDALEFAFAGAGPLLLCENQLLAFDGQGNILGLEMLLEGRCAAAGEDHVILATADSLRTYWTGDDQPYLHSTLPTAPIESMAWQGRWLLAGSGTSLQQIDMTVPWDPEVTGYGTMPLGAGDFLVWDDGLLVASTDGLDYMDLSLGAPEVTGEEHVRLPCRWLCPRGAERVLLLSEEGRLSQVRLDWGIPRFIEWQTDLPLTGAMQVFNDSLRITGEAGILDMALEGIPFERLVRDPKRPTEIDRNRIEKVAVKQVGQQLQIWGRHSSTIQTVALFDLLGRRVLQRSLGGKQIETIALDGLATGRYFLEFEIATTSGDLSRLVQPLTWCP